MWRKYYSLHMKMRQEESLVSDMSRVELLERLYTKRKEIKEFDYDHRY